MDEDWNGQVRTEDGFLSLAGEREDLDDVLTRDQGGMFFFCCVWFLFFHLFWGFCFLRIFFGVFWGSGGWLGLLMVLEGMLMADLAGDSAGRDPQYRKRWQPF